MHIISTTLLVTICLTGIGLMEITNAEELNITRNEIIQRAQFWNKFKVPYDQQKYYSDPDGKEYRTDCSGYVSMVWKLKTSMNTKTLTQVSKLITKEDLLPGDVILKPGVHVLIFEKWADTDKTSYWAYDQTPPANKYHVIKRYPYLGRSGYAPYRYIGVTVDKKNTGSCACPASPINLSVYNAAQSIYCNTEMVGSCDENGLYYCYYLNKYNNNAGTMSLLHTCKEKCHNPYYGKGNARCLNEDFSKIMDDFMKGKRQRRAAAVTSEVIEGTDDETPEVLCDDLQFKTDEQKSGTLRQLAPYHLIAAVLLILDALNLSLINFV